MPPDFSKHLYAHRFDTVFHRQVLSPEEYKTSLCQVQQVLSSLKKEGEAQKLPMLETCFWKKDLPLIESLGHAYQAFESILVFAPKKISLGAKTLTSLYQSWVLSASYGPKLYYIDDLDPDTFWEIMSVVEPFKTGVLVVSQSGETPEILLQFMRCLEYWSDFLSPQELQKRITIITGDTSPNALRKIAHHCGYFLAQYPSCVEESFSCFTVSCLVPAAVIGVDIRQIRLGGSYLLNQAFAMPSSPPVEGAALLWALYQKYGIISHVIMPYGDVFSSLSLWYQQVWGESLGQATKHFGLVCAEDLKDHPGHIHLHLQEPLNKFFTLMHEEKGPCEVPKPCMWNGIPELSLLSRTSIRDFSYEMFCKTSSRLSQQNYPVREIHFAVLHERTLGAFLMHIMIETLLVSRLMRDHSLESLQTPPPTNTAHLIKNLFVHKFLHKKD